MATAHWPQRCQNNPTGDLLLSEWADPIPIPSLRYCMLGPYGLLYVVRRFDHESRHETIRWDLSEEP